MSGEMESAAQKASRQFVAKKINESVKQKLANLKIGDVIWVHGKQGEIIKILPGTEFPLVVKFIKVISVNDIDDGPTYVAGEL